MEESPTKHRVVAYINDRLSLSFGVYLDKDWPIICVSFGALYIPGCLSAVQGIQVRQSLAVPDCSSVTECHLWPLSTSLFARRGPRYRESTCRLSLLRSGCNIASDSPQSSPKPSRRTLELFWSGTLHCTIVALFFVLDSSSSVLIISNDISNFGWQVDFRNLLRDYKHMGRYLNKY